jgi:hypothetical protein
MRAPPSSDGAELLAHQQAGLLQQPLACAHHATPHAEPGPGGPSWTEFIKLFNTARLSYTEKLNEMECSKLDAKTLGQGLRV